MKKNSELEAKKVVLSESDEESEEEPEIYPTLINSKKNEREKKLNLEWRFCGKRKKYFLPGDFSIPAKTYEALFDHQKAGI